MSVTAAQGRKVGDVLQFDVQADIFQRQYRLVEHLGGNRWRCEYLEITDKALDEMVADRWMTDDLIEFHIERTGQTFEITLVSRDEWASYF